MDEEKSGVPVLAEEALVEVHQVQAQAQVLQVDMGHH